MKEKVLPFIIGVLVGAIIATTGFLIYSKMISSNNNPQMNQGGQIGTPPEKKNGEMETPPEKPDGDNGSEPPAKPEDSNN